MRLHRDRYSAQSHCIHRVVVVCGKGDSLDTAAELALSGQLQRRQGGPSRGSLGVKCCGGVIEELWGSQHMQGICP